MTYTARSANDRTEDWPFWMVWDGSLNVTCRVIEKVTGKHSFFPFVTREQAEWLVAQLDRATDRR